MHTAPNAPFDDPQTFQIIGAAFEVRGTYGNVFSEPVYGEAITIELQLRGIPFEREVRLPPYYKGELLPVCYRVDFMCFGEILVEIKALPSMGPLEHGAGPAILARSEEAACAALELRRAEPSAPSSREQTWRTIRRQRDKKKRIEFR